MTTSAQKKLRKASYCGVPFEVKEADVTVGRRVQVFEYPQRDMPFTEDLGRAARRFRVVAFVTGIDYVDKIKKLVEKLETRGSGELIHPWLGRLVVTPERTSTVKYTNRLLYAEISIDFIETGEKLYPNKSGDTSKKTKQTAAGLVKAYFQAVLKELNLEGVQDFVAAALSGNLNKILQIDALKDIAEMFEMAEEVADLASDALSILSSDPKVLLTRMTNALGIGGWASTVNSWRRVVRQVSRLTKSDKVNSKRSGLFDPSSTDYLEAKSTEALESLVRGIAISNAVGASANVGTELDRINESEPVRVMAYEELIDVRNELLACIDEEMLKTSDDDVYQALEAARAAVWEDMTLRAENHARLLSFTPAEVQPVLVLAYDYYGDATRDAEIVERNNIRRPGFVPPVPLKLLSE